MASEPEVMTVEQVAHFLQLPEVTVRQLLRERKLPGRKVGRAWRVLRSELIASLKETD